MSTLAVACAALAAWLAVPATGGLARSAAQARQRPGGAAPRPVWPLVLLLPVGPVLAGAPLRVLVLAALGSGVVAAGLSLWRQRALRAAATATRLRVLECCEQVAGELSVGQPPGQVLGRAAAAWPPLAPVAEAFRMGADVPAAWRAVSSTPGAGDLRHLAAAWQVSHRTGQGLAEAVDRVAARLRATQATRRVVQGELASARATARLVGALPVVALLMGSGAGGDPVAFLLGHPVGLACLAGGLGFGAAGLWWIEALARDVEAAR